MSGSWPPPGGRLPPSPPPAGTAPGARGPRRTGTRPAARDTLHVTSDTRGTWRHLLGAELSYLRLVLVSTETVPHG